MTHSGLYTSSDGPMPIRALAASMRTGRVLGGGRNRDSWCTPRWLADALGNFHLDPCANERSRIEADRNVIHEFGDDGLLEDTPGKYRVAGRTHYARVSDEVFINPPYSRGQALRWINHYKHTDFTFLLRWDPSTTWFRELMQHTKWVWFANQRIQFEPPPGVTGSNNPFPHALYMASYPHGERGDNLRALGRFLHVN